MNLVMEAKSSSKGIGNLEIWYKVLIYLRITETFFVTKSFIWRWGSPYNNNALSFEFLSCFLQSSQISLFSLFSFGQSEVQMSKNHKKSKKYFHFSFVFVWFTHVNAGSNGVNPILAKKMYKFKSCGNQTRYFSLDIFRS